LVGFWQLEIVQGMNKFEQKIRNFAIKIYLFLLKILYIEIFEQIIIYFLLINLKNNTFAQNDLFFIGNFKQSYLFCC
jgi:hypothetical protein